MDKNILIEYSDMKEEIKDLRRRIDKKQRELEKLGRMIVSDSVSCGKRGKKPLQTVKIQGIPNVRIQRKRLELERCIATLERSEIELLYLQNEAEEYIEKIEKSELRIMFRLYYIDDLTWIQVAHRMNQMFPKRKIKYTDENIKKRIQRFFEKNENVHQCPENL